MPIEAVIFDMDGVLVDSEVYWKRAREGFARDVGKVWTMDDQKATMGRNTIEWAHVMKERLSLDMPLQQVMDEIIRRVLAQCAERLPVRPGAIESVHKAASRYRVALASGSPTQVIEYVMTHTELNKVFETIVFGDTIANGKPAPDIYLEALRRLGVAPENSVGIEDSGNGIRSLHNAGMHIIAAPSPEFPLSDDLLKLAEVVIGSLEEFSGEMVEGLS
jgi:HAD superfamily hydrolase (TIGR01509 family)